MKYERGSVTVVAAAMMAIVAVLVLGAADVWRVLQAKSRAQTAADAAALAAAQSLALPDGGTPAGSAGFFAAANGAELLSCACDPGQAEAVAEVGVDVGDLLLIPGAHMVTARARAVVGASLEDPLSSRSWAHSSLPLLRWTPLLWYLKPSIADLVQETGEYSHGPSSQGKAQQLRSAQQERLPQEGSRHRREHPDGECDPRCLLEPPGRQEERIQGRDAGQPCDPPDHGRGDRGRSEP